MLFLDKLHIEFEEVYNNIIKLEEFARYKEFIEENGFAYKTPRMLQKTKW